MGAERSAGTLWTDITGRAGHPPSEAGPPESVGEVHGDESVSGFGGRDDSGFARRVQRRATGFAAVGAVVIAVSYTPLTLPTSGVV